MPAFQIAAAQVPSIRGDVAANVRTHAAAIAAAAVREIAVLVFPELSLTGYEPDLAVEFALAPTDERLTPLGQLAGEHRMTVIVGTPLRNGNAKPYLGAILFGPDGHTQTYAKMHLGGNEPTYFAPGNEPQMFAAERETIGVAICADASRLSHPQTYAEGGGTIYAAGVFLTAEWYATDAPRLAGYAGRFQMLVVMANHAASVGTLASVGKSAVWSPTGELLAEAVDVENCLVVAQRTPTGWCGEVLRL